MGRTTPLCPQCQEVGPDTVIEHSTLGLIQYETCRDCTFHNLSRTSSQGQFVMSCYATQDELNRDRYALHYLTCVRDMKYQMYQISMAYPRYTLTRRGQSGRTYDNAHYEFWCKVETLIEHLFTPCSDGPPQLSPFP